MLPPLILAATLAMPPSLDRREPSRALVAIVSDVTDPKRTLHDVLMEKFHTMNAASKGIFHDDITEAVSPIFPLGQRMSDTKRIIDEQKLGSLRLFKGEQDAAQGTMYVTKFYLMDAMFSHVEVVIDFDFEGPNEANMVLRKMNAFIDASSM
ncbi:MAG: hypothetical protein P4L76_06495 [Beijerinckiaceae bacterium]|nr:hypothetical protein [Beijerinckiaceae bacterium]